MAYSTCSLFRDENEKVVAEVMARRPDLIELPAERTAKFMVKGKPTVRRLLALPWVDGSIWRFSLKGNKRRSVQWEEFTAGE
ncbi:MAG: hypothetical protein ACLUEQ_05560 [Cloacibacillus evryensis]